MFNRIFPRRRTSLLLAIALVLSLVPVLPAGAAGVIQFDSFSTDINSPTQVNSETIEIAGTYSGVAANSLTYKVETIVGNQVQSVTDGTGVLPILEGTNRFRFVNVEIRAGLNKITVSGVSSGQTVSGIAYVYFPNVPTIYDIRLSDNRQLQANQPTLVNTETITVMFNAPNATGVTVQGREAFSGGNNMFLASNIELEEGLNTLVFTAYNNTNTYSITREVVYYNDEPTAYNVAVRHTGSNTLTALDGHPTVGPNDPNGLVGQVVGYFAVERDEGNPSPTLNVTIYDSDGNTLAGHGNLATNVNLEGSVSVTGATYDFNIYSFETISQISITGNDDYTLRLEGNYGVTTINFPILFRYRSADTPIIKEVRQLYNVTESSPISYTSSSLFTDNMTFFEAPIWISVSADNFTPGAAGHSATLATRQGTATFGPPDFAYTVHETNNNEVAFKITNMPAGEQTLVITLERTVGGTTLSDTKEIPLTFIPTPFIRLDNLYDGQVFTNPATFDTIEGKLINFNLSSTDPQTLTITINGTVITVANPRLTINADGEFVFDVDPSVAAENLVNGPNTIVLSATANGVPVTTRVTVYLFPANTPSITTIRPVPVNASSDPDGRFPAGDVDDTYSTEERYMDVLFTVTQTDSVHVSVDGENYSTTGTDLTPDDNKMINEGTASGVTTFRITNLKLPDSGNMSVTVTAARGAATASRTIVVTRTPVPYRILSPKLPQEQVINQNYITLSIQAEGADSITVGKEEMVRGTDDIFRLDINNLKAGNNTIKFTVTTGTNKVNGQVNITYAAQNTVGAEYKTTMPSSRRLSVFNGAVTLQFPKGTMLRQPGNTQFANTYQIELFNNQQLLFGIADPIDGRTAKRYNRVGEVSGGVPQDGNLQNIPADSYAVNVLRTSRAHFGYASDLYWIDAGYFETNANNTIYRTVDGMHPYKRGDEFYIRGQNPSKWLVPTNRGEITIKYNPSIVNEAARNLSIWRFDGVAWTNLGGTVNTSRKTVTASFDGFGYYAVMGVRYGFDDITGHPYARTHLDTMFAKGVMKPRGGNVFGVYENITRGEFATMMVRILDLPLNYDNDQNLLTFNDVPPVSVPGALWDYRYIETAARAGIISGLAPRTFNPNGLLTREQAATIIARALNLKIGDPEKDAAALAKSFVDAGQVDHYAVSHVLAVSKDKIMNGSPLEPGSKQMVFNPKANLSRADMAIIAYNIMTKLRRF